MVVARPDSIRLSQSPAGRAGGGNIRSICERFVVCHRRDPATRAQLLGVHSSWVVASRRERRSLSTGIGEVYIGSRVTCPTPQGAPLQPAPILLTPAAPNVSASYEVVEDETLNAWPSEGLDAPLCPRPLPIGVTLRNESGLLVYAAFTAALL